MKRYLVLTLCAFLLFTAACAPATANPTVSAVSQPEETAAPASTPEPTPTPAPTPEPLGFAPVNLFDRGYNQLIGVPFPDGYTVYAARFDSADAKKGHPDQYILFLTAAGDPAEIVRSCAALLGIVDEAEYTAYANALEKDGRTELTGSIAQSKAYAWLNRIAASDESDAYTSMDGCHIEMAVDISPEQRAVYENLILANCNSSALGTLAESLPEEAVQLDEISIYVNRQRPDQTKVYANYSVDDATALMDAIMAQLSPKWVDETNHVLGITYGRIECDYRFLSDENTVSLTLLPNDNATPAGEFRLSDVSLSKLGFRYDEKARFCLLEDKQNGYMIGISKPEWNRTEEDWNMMFYKDEIYMQYHEETNLFNVSASHNGIQTGCDYDCANNTFGQAWPDEETLQTIFGGILGGAQEDVRAGMFAVFTDLVQQRFGMTWQELYALPVW